MNKSSTQHLNNTTQHKKKILVVTGDLPSHPYAAAKLAKVLAKRGHNVTLASPKGAAYEKCVEETALDTTIKCKAVGSFAETKKHMNARPVVNPHSWSAFWQALLNPFPIPQFIVQQLFDRQEDFYRPIQREIETGGYDIVIPIHSVSITVCDAIEASSVAANMPVVIFNSLPYDPSIFLGEAEAWRMPKSLTAFCHVATFSAKSPSNWLVGSIQTFWKLVDAWITARAWRLSANYNNERRARRGLPPIDDGWRGYFRNYPVISFGGVPPFMDSSVSRVASNVTAVGTLDGNDKDAMTLIDGELRDWIHRRVTKQQGMIYVGFGTGTILSDIEASNITGGLLHCKNSTEIPPVLFALRPLEQKRLRPIFDKAMGASPTSVSDTHIEYYNGLLRIQANVPQAALLKSGLVKAFVSHMGMGGLVEGVKGGVPFVVYPSGCDQYFNAQRAVDAGIGVYAPVNLENVGKVVEKVLRDEEMAGLAKSASKMLEEVQGEQRACDLVEAVIAASSNSNKGIGIEKCKDTPALVSESFSVSPDFMDESILQRSNSTAEAA